MAQDTTTTNDNKQKQNSSNSWEIGEPDFQSYHIIQVNCPVLNKTPQDTKKHEGRIHSIKKIIETAPEKDMIVDLLDKDFKGLSWRSSG